MSDGVDDLSRLQDDHRPARSAGCKTKLGVTMNRRRILQTLSASSIYLLGESSLPQWMKSLKLSGVAASKPAMKPLITDNAFDPKLLRLDSFALGVAIPILKALSREQRLALLPEARRQEAQRQNELHAGGLFKSMNTTERWFLMSGSFMLNDLLDDPHWPTHFQHLRQCTRSVESCIKSCISVPSDADWIYVDEFNESVDQSLRSPARVWFARKGDDYFLRIDDGAVAEEKTRNAFNLVGLIDNLAPAGLDSLKRAVAGRPEFDEVESFVIVRLKFRARRA